MNELRTFSETRIFADVVQAGEVAFVWGAVKQPSVTQHAVSAIFWLLLLLSTHTGQYNHANSKQKWASEEVSKV